jgi:tripartite-type tricarboxylate transporter receptor subunit TctC
MRRAIETDEARATFAKLALLPSPLPPAAFAEFLQAETRTYAAVIRDANIKVE